MTKPPFGVTTGRCRCDLPSQDTPVVNLFAKEQDFSSASSAGCPYLVSPAVGVLTIYEPILSSVHIYIHLEKRTCHVSWMTELASYPVQVHFLIWDLEYKSSQ